MLRAENPHVVEPSALCIKGTAFLIARRDLFALIEAGRFSRTALERRLEEADLAVLDPSPLPTSWYPVATYDCVLRVLMDVEGAGDPRYLVQRARKGMEALMRSGIYKQLERAESVLREAREGWFERTGHILATLPSAFFNRGSWKLSRDEGRRMFTLEGTGLDGMTENVAHIVQGAVEFAAEQLIEAKVEVTVQRPRDGRVVFQGTHA
jgi:hypothetical protein